MNKQCAMYCIESIRCLMQEKPIPQIPEGVSLEDLYAFAKLHGVEAMVFHGLELLDMDEKDPVWQDWRKRTDMLLAQSIVQLTERDALFAALPAAGIPILPVKGCWLKEQYPDIDYRQMSDLDILIRRSDLEKADAVMRRLGYEKEPGHVDHHDGYGKAPYMGIELHNRLLPTHDARAAYYDDVWDKAQPAEAFAGVFRLKPEDEYIYYILHLHRHVLYAGTGIRPFLDSWVYRDIYGDMDNAYLDREFERLGVADFVRSVQTIADCWFGSGEPVPAALEDMARSVIATATYGTEDQLVHNQMRPIMERFRNPLVAKAVYLLRCLFLPLKAMRTMYPVLEKVPVLLPVFWIWRPISRLLFRPEAVRKIVKQTNEGGDKLWSEQDWRGSRSK